MISISPPNSTRRPHLDLGSIAGLLARWRRKNDPRSKCARSFAIAILAAISIGNGLRTSSAQESSAALTKFAGRIDMERVARDIETAARNKSAASAQLPSCTKSTVPAAFVPLFIPRELRSDLEQDCSSSKSAVRSSGPGQGSLLVLEDGYAATRNFDRFIVAIRGTRDTFAGAGEKASAEADYWREFADSESGGEIAFGYAGAHYLASFECKVGGQACVTANEARQIVDSLLLCALEGQCIESGTKQINVRRP